jgi:hypothetical protein
MTKFSDRDIKNYFLGRFSDSDTIEEALFLDDELFKRFEKLEEELILDYLNFGLDQDEFKDFTSHYLSSPSHRDKVTLTAGLIGRLGSTEAASSLAPSPETARGYLLGTLRGNERAAFEDALFATDECFNVYVKAKEQLLEQSLLGTLTKEENDFFLKNPANRSLVALADSLRQIAQKEPAPVPKVSGWVEFLNGLTGLFKPASTFQFGFAAGAVVLVSGLGGFLVYSEFQRSIEKQNLASLNKIKQNNEVLQSENEKLKGQNGELTQLTEKQKKELEAKENQLQTVNVKIVNLNSDINSLRNSQLPIERFFNYTLTSRGTNPVPPDTIRIPIPKIKLTLEIPLESKDETFSGKLFAISPEADPKSPFTQPIPDIKVKTDKGRKTLVVLIPTKYLNANTTYRVVLEGKDFKTPVQYTFVLQRD